ncbi:MAG: hypothetical protein JF630_01135 [Geodermatophilales bacterium]|nr:hypothetical protein [Geodermatophilales bacterium]
MTGPRDRDRFDDGPGGDDWREPSHLGEGHLGKDDPAPSSWEPPGWDLPPATPDRSEQSPPADRTPDPQERGPGPARRRGAVAEVFGYQGDLVGAQAWAVQHGWAVSDGDGPQDAVLRDLIATAPVRPTKDHRPGGVMRGRYGALEIVAFDVVYASGRYMVPQWAITAVPMLGAVPAFRLSPARFWKHRIGGLVPIASGNELLDSRWALLAGEDGPQVRRLAQDPTLQGLLLGTDDGDEFWSAAGHVAAIRPDGHRPQLIEHHARLLTAIVSALTAGY